MHPQHTEAVAWVSERKELLCIFFGLQAMLVWQWFRVSRKFHHWMFAHLLFVLSLLAKQMLITLPFLLVVLEICPLKSDDTSIQWKRIPQAIRSSRVFFLLALSFTVLVFFAQRSGDAIVSAEVLPFHFRLANAVQSIIFYVAQTCVPVRLNPFYRHPLADVSVGLSMLCSAVLIAAGTFIWKNRQRPGILAGALWFLGTLVPVLGLVQLGAAARADRYLYFPHIGLFLLIGSLPAFRRARHPLRTGSFVLVAAALCCCMTWRQAQIWHDSVSLWTACLEIDPDSYRGHDQLALAFLADDQVQEALQESQTAMRYWENRQQGGTYTTLGCALLFSGDTDGAITNLREAIRIRPDDHRALINLGYALRTSDMDESKRLFTEALKYVPMNVEAMANLANCEAEEGNFVRATELLRAAIRIAPKEARLRENLRLFEEAQGQSR